MGRSCTSLSFDAFLDTVLGMRYEGQAGSCLSGGDKMRIRYHSFSKLLSLVFRSL